MVSTQISDLSVRQLLARRRRLAAGLSETERTLRGVLLSEGRRCSSEGCRCRRGELHGPYSYLAVYADGRSRTIYVPAAAQAVVRGERGGDAAQRGAACGGLADQLGVVEAAGAGVIGAQACCPRRSRRSRTWSSARWWRVASVVSATAKITASHLQRVAVVYLRQSSPRQVRENFRSTERQYALAEEAARLGWEAERIAVVDGDLGISGRFSDTQARKGYAQLVARVCLGEVGAIFGLEVSRLARSNAETQRLLEFCALTDTLVVDTDGVYDLQNFNDRLLLGLKSQMSEAELHMITSRLQGAKRAAAERGELRFPLPVGYLHDEDGQTIIDPDQEVQAAIRDLFAAFRADRLRVWRCRRVQGPAVPEARLWRGVGGRGALG